MKCCICGEHIEGYGNNAKPIKKGICCDKCNVKVTMERVRRLKNGKIL